MSRQLFNISRDGNSISTLYNSYQSLSHAKTPYPEIQTEIPVFHFAHCLWSCHWKPLIRTWLHLLYTLFRYLHTLIRSPRALSSPGWTVPALSVFPYEKCSSPLTIFMPLTGLSPIVPCLSFTGVFFCYWAVQNWTQYTRVASPVLSRGEGSPLFGNALSNAAQDTRSHLWGEVTLLAHVHNDVDSSRRAHIVIIMLVGFYFPCMASNVLQ